jgi:HD-GYP domain-containing protein (c-di-GMP phosphodiesterase class II)
LKPIVRHNGAAAGRRFAVASAAELGVMGESGYGGIVLDRLAQQTTDILAVEQSCIFARDRNDSEMTIVAAGRGDAERSIGKRLQVSAERTSRPRTPTAAVELQWEGQVEGALSVWSELQARQFSSEELAILDSLGAAAAAALAHARSRPPLVGDTPHAVRALTTSLAELDAYTAEHSRHVVDTALAVGAEAGLSRAGLAELGAAALLHDIGKIRVPNSILSKPGPLTDGEREVIAQHPGFGAEALMRVPGLEVVAIVVRYHHERWDGSGYPDGLSGMRIPLASRIIAVCDAYSAITSHRAYRAAQSHGRALAELQTAAGTQFDPEIVSHFEAVVERQVLA